MNTYLITGANRGIGLELARQLSNRSDTTVLATAREPDKAADLTRLAHEVLPLDVADPRSIDALSDRVGDRAIDVLINNAGVGGEAKSARDLTQSEFSRVFAINAFGPLLLSRALLKNLRAGSRRTIVSITSQLGSIANNKGGSSYSYRASKAALNQLMVCLANELRSEAFTCVMAHPGWVRTDMGGPGATLAPDESVSGLLKVIDALKSEDSGRFLDHAGRTLPW